MTPISFRSAKSEAVYQRAKKENGTKPLRDVPPIREWIFWNKIPNEFPGDILFKSSYMLLPKRVFSDWWKMYPWEFVELLIIIYKEREASVISLNLGKTRSVSNHFHLHLQTFYDSRKDIKI